jgi:hypothetical protein
VKADVGGGVAVVASLWESKAAASTAADMPGPTDWQSRHPPECWTLMTLKSRTPEDSQS